MRRLLLLGDLAVFAIFAVVGLYNHAEGLTLSSFVRAAGPFAVGWLIFALSFRIDRERIAPRVTAVRILEAWLPAWGVGIILRSLIFGRPLVPAFAAVALLFNGALLAGWRSVASYVESRR